MQGCYLTDEVYYGVHSGRLDKGAWTTAHRWCEYEKEMAPLVIAGKLTPTEEETVDPTIV